MNPLGAYSPLESQNSAMDYHYEFVRAKARVFFVRHGKSVKDTGSADSPAQPSDAKLDEIGKNEMKMVAEYLKKAGITGISDHEIFLFSGDTTRIVESVKIITDELIGDKDHTFYNPVENTKKRPRATKVKHEYDTLRLGTTKKPKLSTIIQKEIENEIQKKTESGAVSKDQIMSAEQRLIENARVFANTARIMKEVRRQVKKCVTDNAAVVIIGHKSNKSGFSESASNKNSPISISFNIENGGIIESDINQKTGEYVNPERHPETLFLTRKNHDSILETLKAGDSKIQDIIVQFEWNIKVSDAFTYPIWHLQNDINAYFYEHQELFSKYLLDPSSPDDLRAFCLYHAINKSENEAIYALLSQHKLQQSPLSLGVLEVFLKYASNEMRKDALITHMFGLKPSRLSWSEKDPEELDDATRKLCEKLKCIDQYHECDAVHKILCESIQRAEGIFTKSIDISIQKTKLLISSQYFSRESNTNILLENTSEPLNKSALPSLSISERRLETNQDYNSSRIYGISDILSKDAAYTALIGHVWEGKSTELGRMMQELLSNPEHQNTLPLFYWAKESNTDIINTIQKDINTYRALFPNRKIVIFFDGIDELERGIRDSVVSFLTHLSKNEKKDSSNSNGIAVIMGARPSEFQKNEGDGMILRFCSMESSEIESFIRSKLHHMGIIEEEQQDEKIQEIQTFLESGVLEKHLKNTPLILSFLCKIVSEESEKPLSELVLNRADLYDKIASRILRDHQGNRGIKDSVLWRNDRNRLFNTLGYCAYLRNNNNEQIQIRDIEKYLEEEEGIDDAQERNKILDQIFLLYKKEDGGYEFILKSFEEFFLAHYYYSTLNKNGVHDIIESSSYKIMTQYGRKQYKPAFFFYAELLIARKKISELETFLGESGILSLNDPYGESVLLGFEIFLSISSQLSPELSKKIGEKYLAIIRSWKEEDVFVWMENICNLSSNTSFIANEYFQQYIQHIVSIIKEIDDPEKTSSMLYKLNHEEITFNTIMEVTNTTSSHDSIREKKRHYEQLLFIQQEKSLKTFQRIRDTLFEEKKFDELLELLQILRWIDQGDMEPTMSSSGNASNIVLRAMFPENIVYSLIEWLDTTKVVDYFLVSPIYFMMSTEILVKRGRWDLVFKYLIDQRSSAEWKYESILIPGAILRGLAEEALKTTEGWVLFRSLLEEYCIKSNLTEEQSSAFRKQVLNEVLIAEEEKIYQDKAFPFDMDELSDWYNDFICIDAEFLKDLQRLFNTNKEAEIIRFLSGYQDQGKIVHFYIKEPSFSDPEKEIIRKTGKLLVDHNFIDSAIDFYQQCSDFSPEISMEWTSLMKEKGWEWALLPIYAHLATHKEYFNVVLEKIQKLFPKKNSRMVLLFAVSREISILQSDTFPAIFHTITQDPSIGTQKWLEWMHLIIDWLIKEDRDLMAFEVCKVITKICPHDFHFLYSIFSNLPIPHGEKGDGILSELCEISLHTNEDEGIKTAIKLASEILNRNNYQEAIHLFSKISTSPALNNENWGKLEDIAVLLLQSRNTLDATRYMSGYYINLHMEMIKNPRCNENFVEKIAKTLITQKDEAKNTYRDYWDISKITQYLEQRKDLQNAFIQAIIHNGDPLFLPQDAIMNLITVNNNVLLPLFEDTIIQNIWLSTHEGQGIIREKILDFYTDLIKTDDEIFQETIVRWIQELMRVWENEIITLLYFLLPGKKIVPEDIKLQMFSLLPQGKNNFSEFFSHTWRQVHWDILFNGLMGTMSFYEFNIEEFRLFMAIYDANINSESDNMFKIYTNDWSDEPHVEYEIECMSNPKNFEYAKIRHQELLTKAIETKNNHILERLYQLPLSVTIKQ